jgi:hypothetical protein
VPSTGNTAGPPCNFEIQSAASWGAGTKFTVRDMFELSGADCRVVDSGVTSRSFSDALRAMGTAAYRVEAGVAEATPAEPQIPGKFG